ncbi:DUF6436 domain-containing protein [Stenotrophomonas maltophilia]|uniref:DUF6436 domain-containing protein n=1 Tax=Stenotrophomonas maltophilia TaxID=40324 RepID=UPI000C25D05E|nr:DUF6436 domain-containing protein [Stenotrophomonas maltophilia]MCU1068086.1 thioredoxin family protein [Stenotrophomonas maltophilia]MCU1076948.1 thioredoxin family protein [Stenotrophomonas maltophilia]MCU1138496.1 thioredoxin family protein [Stenotrophomonas maltophilia]PJL60404.1 thiol-disulfide isomerase [Stenotrophomonas maltophilia]
MGAGAPRRRWLLPTMIALACLFMAGVAAALWQYFGYSAQSTFTEQAIVFDDSQLRLPADLAGDTGRIRVVHFWDPACGVCNRETGAHLSYLISMYRRAGIDFYAIRRPGTQGELPEPLRNKVIHLPTIGGIEHIPASPAVAIWDRQGHLAYAGPYSIGMVCNSANSFVEPLLDRLVRGETVRPKGLLAVGCYCPWQDKR